MSINKITSPQPHASLKPDSKHADRKQASKSHHKDRSEGTKKSDHSRKKATKKQRSISSVKDELLLTSKSSRATQASGSTDKSSNSLLNSANTKSGNKSDTKTLTDKTSTQAANTNTPELFKKSDDSSKGKETNALRLLKKLDNSAKGKETNAFKLLKKADDSKQVRKADNSGRFNQAIRRAQPKLLTNILGGLRSQSGKFDSKLAEILNAFQTNNRPGRNEVSGALSFFDQIRSSESSSFGNFISSLKEKPDLLEALFASLGGQGKQSRNGGISGSSLQQNDFNSPSSNFNFDFLSASDNEFNNPFSIDLAAKNYGQDVFNALLQTQLNILG